MEEERRQRRKRVNRFYHRSIALLLPRRGSPRTVTNGDKWPCRKIYVDSSRGHCVFRIAESSRLGAGLDDTRSDWRKSCSDERLDPRRADYRRGLAPLIVPYVALIESLCPRDVITGWRLARKGVNPRNSRGSYPPSPILLYSRSGGYVRARAREYSCAFNEARRNTRARYARTAGYGRLFNNHYLWAGGYRARQIGSRISPRAHCTPRGRQPRFRELIDSHRAPRHRPPSCLRSPFSLRSLVRS